MFRKLNRQGGNGQEPAFCAIVLDIPCGGLDLCGLDGCVFDLCGIDACLLDNI
ncbi:hypothetical protein [Thermococcus celericrescens]|uniref:hypothetical protein n=1 Tax=Thermococcus celericrescens TaxID=227598 RepID=UPI0012ED7129|nr:hypothetical protein [Thermococcus celericrescens]